MSNLCGRRTAVRLYDMRCVDMRCVDMECVNVMCKSFCIELSIIIYRGFISIYPKFNNNFPAQ